MTSFPIELSYQVPLVWKDNESLMTVKVMQSNLEFVSSDFSMHTNERKVRGKMHHQNVISTCKIARYKNKSE